MTVIAMTREMGTLGKEVARLLAERLETRLVYHELVEDQPDPAERSGPSEVKRHLGNGGENGAANGARSNGASRRNDRMTAVELFELASRGNVIIRGWGAVRLLHRIPHVFCLRVCAPMELRVAEMTRRLGIGERAARREIERSDGLHSGVFQRFFGGDWRDAVNYDLVVNTARITPADAADLVMDAIARPAFEETAESRQALADQLTEARIASFLAGDPATAGFARNVYVAVSGGSVSLYGSVRFEGSAREVADAVLARAGVSDVRNEIQTVGAYANA